MAVYDAGSRVKVGASSGGPHGILTFEPGATVNRRARASCERLPAILIPIYNEPQIAPRYLAINSYGCTRTNTWLAGTNYFSPLLFALRAVHEYISFTKLSIDPF